MPRQRIPFCGVIEGSVSVRSGETEEEAIERAQSALQALLDERARLYFQMSNGKRIGGGGPAVGLEPE